MTISNIDTLPPAPQRSDPTTFPAKADAMMSALVTFVPEMNAAITGINAAQVACDADAATATAAAATTVATANATAWVNGNTYALNANAISQINFQTYRKKTASSVSTIDPVNDPTNWTPVGAALQTIHAAMLCF